MKISRANRFLLLFGLLKIPLIAFVRPKIVELNDEKIVLKIPLRRRSRNHLKSMYLGALVIGADVASGFLAFIKQKESDKKMSLAFKTLRGEFIKRPMSDTFFECINGKLIDQMIAESTLSGERINKTSVINVFTDYYNEKELVAVFELEVSIKIK